MQAIRCLRPPAGTMELGAPTVATSSTESVGGTSLLLVQDPGTASAEGEMYDFIVVWAFDSSLRLLDVVTGLSDDGAMRVEGDALHVGSETRTLVGGELVAPPVGE